MRRTNKLSDKCSALSVKNGFEIIYKKLFYHAEFLFILTEYLKRLAQSIVGWIASLNRIFEAHKSPERNKTRRTHEYALFISTSANINPASKFTGKQNYIFINIIMCVCVFVFVLPTVCLHLLLLLTYCHTERVAIWNGFVVCQTFAHFIEESCMESQLQ